MQAFQIISDDFQKASESCWMQAAQDKAGFVVVYSSLSWIHYLWGKSVIIIMSVCVFAGECVLALKSMIGCCLTAVKKREISTAPVNLVNEVLFCVTIFMGFPAERPVQKQPLCLGLSKYTTLFWCLKAQRALPVNFEFIFLSYFDLSIIYVTGRWKLAPRGGKRRRQTPLTNPCVFCLFLLFYFLYFYIFIVKNNSMLFCVV